MESCWNGNHWGRAVASRAPPHLAVILAWRLTAVESLAVTGGQEAPKIIFGHRLAVLQMPSRFPQGISRHERGTVRHRVNSTVPLSGWRACGVVMGETSNMAGAQLWLNMFRAKKEKRKKHTPAAAWPVEHCWRHLGPPWRV